VEGSCDRCSGHEQGNGFPLNQNRNQNRRRGRGSNRGGPGGGNQGNRIDSRARGNAPQMLEKYKKLAHDASLNGDRVQMEYYLQFADHYFRVVADSRAQQNDQRPRRDDRDNDRDQDREQSFDDDDGRDDSRDDGRNNGRDEPRRGRERSGREEVPSEEGQRGSEGQEAEAAENPFVREDRPRQRGRKPAAGKADQDREAEAGFDAGVLPPSISREEGEAKPRPAAKSRTRRPRTSDDGEETLEAVS
jgi:hypothetical protein